MTTLHTEVLKPEEQEAYDMVLRGINESPTIQSLLYDMNLMPEQVQYGSPKHECMVNIAWHFALYAAEREQRTPQPDAAAIRDQLLDQVIGICNAEMLTDDIECSEDIAYNIAIDHVKDAIYKFLSTTPAAPVITDGWLPIESAPKDGTLFIGFNADRSYRAFHIIENLQVTYSNGDMRWDGSNGMYNIELTHWMPLPAAPIQLKDK